MNHDELFEQIKVTCVSVVAFRDAINKCENKLNSLCAEIIEIKDALRFSHVQKSFDLPSLTVLNQKVHDELIKVENIKLREKIDRLMECLDRQSEEINELEGQVKSCDKGLRDYAGIVANLNLQIHKLQNPQCYPKQDSCEGNNIG